MQSLPVSGRGGPARGSLQPRRELHPSVSILIIIIVIISTILRGWDALPDSYGMRVPPCPSPTTFPTGQLQPRGPEGCSFSQVGWRGELGGPVRSPRSSRLSWQLLIAWGMAHGTRLCSRCCQGRDGLSAPELEPRPVGACSAPSVISNSQDWQVGQAPGRGRAVPDSKGKLRHSPAERRAGCSPAWLTWRCQPRCAVSPELGSALCQPGRTAGSGVLQ